MKYKNIGIVFTLLLLAQQLKAQEIDAKSAAFELEKFPTEQIFLHTNNNTFLSGEYLYYKLYVLNSKTKNLSSLSKVAYVDLLNEEKKIFFSHKLNLKEGLASGHIFLPTSLISGSYKLTAYTNWMKNNKTKTFTSCSINVINPYNTRGVMSQKTDTVSTKKSLSKSNILTNNKTYATRSKVSLELSKYKQKLKEGNFSISIRKLNSFDKPNEINAISFKQKLESDQLNHLKYLPDLRGENIQGKVLLKENNQPAKNVIISASFNENNTALHTTITNNAGEFTIINNSKNANVYLQSIDNNIQDYTIHIKEKQLPNYSELKFEPFYISKNWKDEIVQRSIANQIESAYYKSKPDSILNAIKTPLLAHHYINYDLSDYTSFKNLEETFKEIVKKITINSSKKHGKQILLQTTNFGTRRGVLPLILLDGVLIQNHDDLLKIAANSIQNIKVYRNEYIFGLLNFQGAILIESKSKSHPFINENNDIVKISLQPNQKEYNYFKQSYKENKTNKIPDYRYQLDWNPNLSKDITNSTYHLYTSDVKGTFIIEIEGFSKLGEPISLTSYFNVE